MTDPRAEEVRAANSSFYAAFEARDLDAMAEVWEHSDRIVVTHPGWGSLRGWPKMLASWDAIFRNTPYIQFVLTDEEVSVVGDVGWVTVDENILQATGSPDGGAADTEELSDPRSRRRTYSCTTAPAGGWWCTTARQCIPEPRRRARGERVQGSCDAM